MPFEITRVGGILAATVRGVPGGLSSAITRLIATAADELLVTQSELARRSGVSQSQISRVFSGERVFSVDQLDAICDALGLSILAVIHDAKKSRDASG